MRRLILIAIPYVWLLVLFLIPFVIVLKISLSDTALARPPYFPQWDWSLGWQGIKDFFGELDFENFVFLTTDSLYWKAYLSSVKIAVISTLLTLLVGFPIAYGMARAPEEWRPTLMMLVILPFWTSFLIRVYSWMGILSQGGLLNSLLLSLGIISEPLIILNTDVAVYIGITYTYLPFMILPVYAALEKLDGSLLEHLRLLAGDAAAVETGRDRGVLPRLHSGHGRIRDPLASRRIADPDDRQGAVRGILLQPRLAGGVRRRRGPAADPRDPDRAVPAERAETAGGRGMRRFSAFNAVSLTLGFAFLYLPMIILVIYSFNESKLVTVWAGFSTKWYGELMRNEAFLDAALVTLKVAVMTSTLATVLGTCAAYVLVRIHRFPGRTLFSGMIYAPLVMPDVILGLSLLLLFIGVNIDRGVLTIVLAHTTFAMCYVSVVVSSRLVAFDQSLEEACPPADHRARRDLGLAAGLHPVAGRSGDRVLHRRAVLHHPADEDLLRGAAWRFARDQRAVDDHDRHRDGRRHHRLAHV